MEPLLRFGVIGDAWRLYQRRWGTWSLATLIVLVAYSVVSSALFAAFGMHGPRGRAASGSLWGPAPGRCTTPARSSSSDSSSAG